MLHLRTHTLRASLLAFGFITAAVGMAQNKFTVHGRLKIEGGDVEGARAVLYKNGEKERTITSSLNKFSLDLDLNANYIVSFEKEGYVSKKISFNTKVPPESAGTPFTPFDYAVSLFKQYDDINIVVFNQPVGLIRFEPNAGDFDYDTDYTKSIQSQLQQVLAQVQEKQKEEAANAEADAKRKVEEAKQAEKAAADAKKQADANAKAEAARAEAERKAQQEREAQARKEEEERKRAEQVKVAEVKQPPPPPPVQEKKPEPPPVAEKPRPTPPEKPVRAPVERNTTSAQVHQDEYPRRTAPPVMAEEASRVAPARTVSKQEERPEEVVEEPVTERQEELVVEPNKVMTIVKLETDGVTTEYRKVIHKWGGTFFFKNGEACTQLVYEREALAEQLAGATPRGKMD